MKLTLFRGLIALLLLVAGFFAGRRMAEIKQKSVESSPAVSEKKNAAKISFVSTREARIKKDDSENQLKARVELLVADLTSDARFDEFLEALRAWAAIDPEAALAFARQHLNKACESQARIALLTDWAKRDPQSAWTWAGEKFPEEGRNIAQVLSEIGKADPNLAWLLAAGYSGKFTEQAQYAFSCALQGMLFVGDYQTAVDLMNRTTLPIMPDGFDGKYALADTIASAWAQYEPKNAAGWALSLPEGSIALDRSLVNVGQMWAENSPDDAANFAQQLPSGNSRDNVLTQVLAEWMNQDPAQAALWMNQFQSDPGLDNAKAAFAGNPKIADANIDIALAWANSITDEYTREYKVSDLIERWGKSNPAAAMNYLQTSPDLAPEMREDIIDSLTLLNRLPQIP